MLDATRAPIDSEGMVLGNVFTFQLQGENPINDLEIPFQHFKAANTGMRVLVEVDAIYYDDQYENDLVVFNKGRSQSVSNWQHCKIMCVV